MVCCMKWTLLCVHFGNALNVHVVLLMVVVEFNFLFTLQLSAFCMPQSSTMSLCSWAYFDCCVLVCIVFDYVGIQTSLKFVLFSPF